MPTPAPAPFETTRGGVTLRGEVAGEGPDVLLLHGLTATRRYVVHGSRVLERAGLRVAAFDARGHGDASPAPAPEAYSYREMVQDALAVLDDLGMERAMLVGQSMGAATAVALALAAPERVTALGLVTPAHLGRPSADLDRWDRLATGLERGGVDGFLAAIEPLDVPERYREPVRATIRQRLERHRDPEAVADALRNVPRTRAFDGLEPLGRLAVPTLVVGSRDEIDGGHPLAVAEEWASRIPGARLVVEEQGESPLAWRGGRLSEALVGLADRAGLRA